MLIGAEFILLIKMSDLFELIKIQKLPCLQLRVKYVAIAIAALFGIKCFLSSIKMILSVESLI